MKRTTAPPAGVISFATEIKCVAAGHNIAKADRHNPAHGLVQLK